MTWRASRSSSEYTATEPMPSSFSARTMRTAISPRLATKTLSNMWTGAYLAQGSRRGVVGAGMRSYVVSAVLLACLALAAPSQAALFKSDNVSEVGALPEAVGAIGARFSPDGHTMYVTSATGLGIYDVSAPETPQRLSRLALPHFENEDVDVGHIGGRDYVIVTNDPSFTGVGVIYVIDVTNPSTPSLASATPVEVPGLDGVATNTP